MMSLPRRLSALATLWILTAVPFLAAALPFPQEKSDLPADSAVRWGRLDNGIRYAIMANHAPRGRASLRFAVNAGSLNETDSQRGLAHFLEHMAFNGSTHFAPGTLVEYFQRLGMSFGGDTNAFTAFDRTEYQLELPDVKPETLDRALTLFADYDGGLLLEPKSIDKERGIILSEKRARDSVEYRQYVDELNFLFPHARLPQRMPIGLPEVVEQAQRDRFADFYNAWYRPQGTIIVAVGDFDPAVVEALIRQDLGSVVARTPSRPQPPLDTVLIRDGVFTRLHTEPEAPATEVSIEEVSPYRTPPDIAANRLKYLPRDLAVAMLNRRLAILAKKEGTPFSEAEAAVAEEYHFYRDTSIGAVCKPEQWRAALAAEEQELRRALRYGFQPAELREIVAGFGNQLEQAVRTASTRRSPKLASELVDTVIDGKVFTAPATDLALFGPALQRVTVDDCLTALRAAWNETPGRFIYVTGNLTLADPPKEILAAYRASEAVPVAPPIRIEESTFAYTDFGPPGRVVSRREVADLGLTLVEFQNGVRLNLKRTDFEAGRIRLNIRLGGGRLTEPKSKPGLSILADSTFFSGGLGKLGIDDLQRVLAGKTVEINFKTGNDAFELGGATNRSDLLLQLQLLGAFVTDPGYRPEAMRQFVKEIDQAYNEFAHTVEGPFETDVPRLLADGDSRFGVPPREVELSRTEDEVRSWLAPQLASGPIEIAIVGDLDRDATITAIARTFGALPPRQAKPAYADERRVSFPAKPLVKRYTVPTEIPRGIVELRWPATDARDVRLARRLSLLAAVLDDRLRVKLREQMGDTYSPEAGADLSDTFFGYGFIVAQAAVEPAKAPAVAGAIRAVASDLAHRGVTPDELDRAKRPALTAIRESMRRNDYWLSKVLAAAQEQPYRLDWCRTRLSDFESITKADLDLLAKQYLDPARAFEITSVPK